MSTVESASTIDRFRQALARCGLFERRELDALIRSAPAPARSDARRLADHLVEKSHLTHFQAAKLLKGVWQGLVLGRYQILAPLGRGGMSTVYLARVRGEAPRNAERGTRSAEPEGGHPFRASSSPLRALKVLPPKMARTDERKLARFLREMELAERVSHPHLTQTFDAGQIQGVYYIAMEYIRGQSLTRRVNEHGPLPVARAARLFSEVAAGIGHAHQKGLIHRDLKPSNIMVTPNGHAKVLDLGFALSLDEELPADKTILGGQGYVVGTMDYIAPEQVDDPTGVDHRADLYSLGCSLYFALTGQPPFPGGTSIQKMQRHRTEYPEPLAELNPTVPADFARLVARLMDKDPRRRYPDAEAVRQALWPWAAGDPALQLDVALHESEEQTIHEVESAHSDAPSVWDAIPLVPLRTGASGSAPAVEAAADGLQQPEGSPAKFYREPVGDSLSGSSEVRQLTTDGGKEIPFLLDSLHPLLRAFIYVVALVIVTLLIITLRG